MPNLLTWLRILLIPLFLVDLLRAGHLAQPGRRRT